MKPGDPQQVEGKKTEGISQQVESAATSPSLERSVSFEIIPMVTQGDGHIADQDVDDDQGHAMNDVKESIVIGRTS